MDSKKFECGNSIEWFFDKVSDLGDCTIYFHNLKFDGTFIIDWLFRNGFEHTTERKIYKNQFSTLISDKNLFYSIKLKMKSKILKSLAPEDIWLHVNRFHSAHVGIAADGKDVPDEVIAKAAAICAYYSQARGRDKVTVDYTRRKYVKKPPKANLGFVIYTDYSNIIVTPDPHRECAKN